MSERLREERERLGFNQTDFGALGGVQKRSQINYESGERLPDAEYLSALAMRGVDVLYVLTGSRSFVPPTPFSPEHRALIRDYEASSADGQEAIRRMAAATALGAAASGKAPAPKKVDFLIQANQVGPVVKKAKSLKRVTINMGERKK